MGAALAQCFEGGEKAVVFDLQLTCQSELLILCNSSSGGGVPGPRSSRDIPAAT